MKPARFQPARSAKQKPVAKMEGIESSSQANDLQKQQQILEAEKQRRSQAKRQVASQAELIFLQHQLEAIQPAFG